MAISIDLGLKSYEIQDTDGDVVGVIKFNPSDPGLLTRWKAAKEQMKEVAASATALEDFDQLDELDARIKAILDNSLGAPVSAVLFRGVSSLALCASGKMVLENILEAIAPLIESEMEKAAKASAARMKKHTAKYSGSKAGLAPEQK